MKLDPRQYDEMVSRASPPSPVVRDCAWAFLVGGAICTLGEALRQFFLIWYDKTLAGTLTSIALIFLSAIFTLPGWYQKLAAKAGAGTLVPITGFANSVVSPAIEFKAEGWVTGVGENFRHRGAGHRVWDAGQLCVGRALLAAGKGGVTDDAQRRYPAV